MTFGDWLGACTLALGRVEAAAAVAKRGSRNGTIQCDTLTGGCVQCAERLSSMLRDIADELDMARRGRWSD